MIPFSNTSLPLPVLKLAQWHQGGQARQQFIHELGRAARDYGFFYLTEHGISDDQIQYVQQLSKQFFALPLTQKQQVAMVKSPHFRGYSTVGSELTNGRSNQREQFDFMLEEAALAPEDIHAHWQHLIGPNQWPNALPTMRDTMLSWPQQLSDISMKVVEASTMALEQPSTAFKESIGAQRYAHTERTRDPQRHGINKQGIGVHKSRSSLTLVLLNDRS